MYYENKKKTDILLLKTQFNKLKKCKTHIMSIHLQQRSNKSMQKKRDMNNIYFQAEHNTISIQSIISFRINPIFSDTLPMYRSVYIYS